MSNLKKKLRALGAKVKKSTHTTDPMADASAAARMSMWVNAQVVAATEKGLQMGLGIDAAESLRLLAVENGRLRGDLQRIVDRTDSETDRDSYIESAGEWLKTNPPQRFVLKPPEPIVVPNGPAPEYMGPPGEIRHVPTETADVV